MDAITFKIRRIRKWKTIYVIIALLLILFNLFSVFVQLSRGGYRYMPEGTAERIGYYIGSYIFILFGLFLLLRVYNMQKRIRYLEQQQLEQTIDAIGNETDASA